MGWFESMIFLPLPFRRNKHFWRKNAVYNLPGRSYIVGLDGLTLWSTCSSGCLFFTCLVSFLVLFSGFLLFLFFVFVVFGFALVVVGVTTDPPQQPQTKKYKENLAFQGPLHFWRGLAKRSQTETETNKIIKTNKTKQPFPNILLRYYRILSHLLSLFWLSSLLCFSCSPHLFLFVEMWKGYVEWS